MTQIEKIKSYVKALAEYLPVGVARYEQSAKRPPYIFLSYKTLSMEPEPAQGIIETQTLDPADETKVIKTEVRESDDIVSLNLIGSEDDYHTLWRLAEKAYAWIDSSAGADKADELGIGVSVTGPIQDRTIVLETLYEHKLGFDIKIKQKTSSSETVDALDLQATIEEIEYE